MSWLKKHVLLVIIAIIIALLIFINYTKGYKVDTTLQGMKYRIGDSAYSDHVTIKVKGIYYDSLFKHDTFEGTISVDKYAYTSEIPLLPLYFVDGHASLHYADTHMRNNTLGFLFCTPDFDKVIIAVDEPLGNGSQGWNGKNGIIITAPAVNRSQANNIIDYLSNKYVWLSNITLE